MEKIVNPTAVQDEIARQAVIDNNRLAALEKARKVLSDKKANPTAAVADKRDSRLHKLVDSSQRLVAALIMLRHLLTKAVYDSAGSYVIPAKEGLEFSDTAGNAAVSLFQRKSSAGGGTNWLARTLRVLGCLQTVRSVRPTSSRKSSEGSGSQLLFYVITPRGFDVCLDLSIMMPPNRADFMAARSRFYERPISIDFGVAGAVTFPTYADLVRSPLFDAEELKRGEIIVADIFIRGIKTAAGHNRYLLTDNAPGLSRAGNDRVASAGKKLKVASDDSILELDGKQLTIAELKQLLAGLGSK